MAKRGSLPTTQEINRLYERAASGDQNAADQLGELNNKLAKRANERMRDIERQGLAGTSAYQIAKYKLGEEGREYFSQSRKLDPEALAENLTDAVSYLRAQTSTAGGEKARRKNIASSIKEAGVLDQVADELNYDEDTLTKKLMEFFDTDAWEDIRKHNRGGTNVLVTEAVEALNNGALIGDLARAFKDFQRGADTDYIELWDNWTSAGSYYKSGSWHELKRPRR